MIQNQVAFIIELDINFKYDQTRVFSYVSICEKFKYIESSRP